MKGILREFERAYYLLICTISSAEPTNNKIEIANKLCAQFLALETIVLPGIFNRVIE